MAGGTNTADSCETDVPGGVAEVGELEADELARMVDTPSGEHQWYEAARGVGHHEQPRWTRERHSDRTADVDAIDSGMADGERVLNTAN